MADDIRRVIGLGSQILRELGVGRMTVLGAPQKIVGLDGYGLTIDGWREFKPPRGSDCPSRGRKSLRRSWRRRLWLNRRGLRLALRMRSFVTTPLSALMSV